MKQTLLKALHITQSFIIAVQGQQLLVFAPFHDLTLVHHTDLIRVTDRRETVGDHYGRTVLHQVLQRFLHQTFGFRIQGGCGLIQDQDRGIL